MIFRLGRFNGEPMAVACDARCDKARGIWERTFRQNRPRLDLDPLGLDRRCEAHCRSAQGGRKAEGARRTAGRGLGAHLAPTLGLLRVRSQGPWVSWSAVNENERKDGSYGPWWSHWRGWLVFYGFRGGRRGLPVRLLRGFRRV